MSNADLESATLCSSEEGSQLLDRITLVGFDHIEVLDIATIGGACSDDCEFFLIQGVREGLGENHCDVSFQHWGGRRWGNRRTCHNTSPHGERQ